MSAASALLASVLLAAAPVAAEFGPTGVQGTDSPASSNATIAPLDSRSRNLDAITIPQMLSYQGRLTDTLGQPVADTTYSVDFRLYTARSGGSPFWTETQSVTTKDGLFSILLGAVTPINSMPDAGTAYLGMAVAGGPELSPRLRIVSAAYSYLAERAANSGLLQGRDTTGFVRAGQANSVTSAMIANGTIAAADLGQMGATANQVLKWSGSVWAPCNDSVGGGSGDSAWVRGTPDSVLFTIRNLGIARGGAGNMLYGSNRFGHVNLGSACTTGTSGQDYNYCTVGGGYRHIANDDYATVSGGAYNTAAGQATVGGGLLNAASGWEATIAGGGRNTADGGWATIAGGYEDTASGDYAAVGGGYQNTASGEQAVVAGGYHNEASGRHAVVPGGSANSARGSVSLAAGRYARANHRGSFVWSDSTGIADSVYSTGNDQFRVRARGGTWFYSNYAKTTGVYLASGSNSWAGIGSYDATEDFRPVDRKALLEKVAALRVRNYKTKDQNDGTRHIGPAAPDFHAAFGYGETGTGINLADADGVALAAIQALYDRVEAQQAEIEALKAELKRR